MTEPKETKWLRKYSDGRKELKENALKNGSLPDYANFDLEFWKEIYEEGKQSGAEENGIQIHKTSELDFPESGIEVLCFGKMWNGTRYKAILKYDGCFHDENGTPYEPEIKAWCKIPQFEDAE